jgi:uncharacterized membrane protein HdeD (DUF308 family)
MTKISSNNNNYDQLRQRPTGVTILGVLFVIAGAFSILGGIATLVAIPFVANVNPNVINDELQLNGQQQPLTPSEQTALAQGSGSILTVLGAVLIPLGIASLVVAYGLFKGKSWAWFVAIVLSIIGLAVNVISLVTSNMGAMAGALVGIAINAIVLWESGSCKGVIINYCRSLTSKSHLALGFCFLEPFVISLLFYIRHLSSQNDDCYC